MAETSNTLWKLADGLRNKHSLSIADVLQEATSQGLTFTPEDVRNLAVTFTRSFRDPSLLPEFVGSFIVSYFKERHVTSVLDAWTNLGEILAPLVDVSKPTCVVALSQSFQSLEVARYLQPSHIVEWRHEKPLQGVQRIDEQFDAVIGCPPLGMEVQAAAVENLDVDIRDEYAHLLLLMSSLRLSDSGSAVFILPPKFLFDRNDGRVVSSLSRFGLHLNAALHLPAGTFSPITSLSGLLVILSRNPSPRLFVGEITADENQQRVLLNNFRTQKEGKSPQLGALVDFTSYRSFPAYVQLRELDNLVRSMGVVPRKLSDLCVKMSLPKRKEGDEFTDLPNSIYLPTIGNSPAVTTFEDLRIKPQNYVQLVVNPDEVLASYLAQFFNTLLGHKIRAAFTSGMFIPKLTKTSLGDIVVPLPEMDVQVAVIRTQAAITDITSQLDTLNRDLWSYPRRYKVIEKYVQAMQPANAFEEWLETLPFPLASILWAYTATADIDRKTEHLFFFFEALAEFVTIVLLSSYAADTVFYKQESGAWVDKDDRYRNWIAAADFGGWRILGERLASATRTLRENKDKRDTILKLFGYPSSEFLEMITNKKLFAVLKQVNQYRNDWKGHSGVLGDAERQQHLLLLESSLSDMQNVMQDKWSSALLLQPGMSEFSDGVYDYQVKALIGTRTQFRQRTVKTLVAMDKKKILYVTMQLASTDVCWQA